MILKGLELDFFRNYVHTEVTFSPGVNVIWGENAQGKTNLLEAAVYLSSPKLDQFPVIPGPVTFGREIGRAHV